MRKHIIAAALLAALSLDAAGALAAPPGPAPRRAVAPPADCAGRGDLRFVCGPADAEDLVQVPGTQWIITSGMSAPGGGLFLVDSRTKTAHQLQLGSQIRARHNAGVYPGCAQPPSAAGFEAQGLSLRARPGGDATLYVVGHGEREAIEVFDVRTLSPAPPVLFWVGCVRMPAAAGTKTNAVTSLADGTLYATVFYRPGSSLRRLFAGQPTGDVYRWRPGSTGFTRVRGLSLSGDNGISASADGRELYLVASGTRQLLAYSLSNLSRPLRSVRFSSFIPDNIHPGPAGQLIVAGMRYDEPACGGPPKLPNDRSVLPDCHRGSVVALVDPVTLHCRLLYDGAANPAFSGAATGLVIGEELWLSSFTEHRVAYVMLPGALTPSAAAP